MPPNSIRISIIVPVYNSPQELRECLAMLVASSCPGSEIIVVDDGSTDNTAEIAAEMGVRVLRLPKNSGPSAARNYGASQARGDIFFFVDADVVVMPGAAARILETFEKHPDVAATFGSYDTSPRANGVVSQYRNLLHHFVHQKGSTEASTFWAGCGAIRRRAFEQVRGFDETRFARKIEDIELGYRLREAGYRILLDKGLLGTHLKKWTLRSMIRTDVIYRADPWARLILESKIAPPDLNLRPGQRMSAALAVLFALSLLLTPFQFELIDLSAAALFGVVALNRKLYAFFFRQRGLCFASACVPLHLLYYLYSSATYLYVWVGFQLRGSAESQPRP